MGQIANQMALELFFKIKERIKEKKKQKQANKGYLQRLIWKFQFADAKRLKQNIAETMDYTIY